MNQTTSKKSPWRRIVLLGGAGLLSGSILAFAPWGSAKEGEKAAPLQIETATAPASNPQYPSLAPVIKNVASSVVKVSVSSKDRLSRTASPNLPPDLWRFFGEGKNMPPQMPMPKQQGVGSGVIVTRDGYILTNNHVVNGMDEIKVALNDGREFTGKVIGQDPKTEIALIKIDASDLPAITLADSDRIEVGDTVLAIGNPFGIGQTVTSGIISAKGRASFGLDYEDFIQTDAAINPGNSGGALVDVEGRLIGINTAILSHSGGNQGVGFAVPTNIARWVMESLVKNGRVDRGFLGVNIQDLTPALAKQFHLDESKGALVAEVTPGSPAAKAGLKSGDLIIGFNGKTIADSRHLKLQVGATLPGSTVPVEILRDGSRRTLDVTMKQLPGEKVAKQSSPSDKAEDALHGVAVSDLDRATREELKVPTKLEGAVITQVDENAPAYAAGLRQGDIITEINRKPVKNAEEAVASCEKQADKATLVKIWRDGGSRYVVVDQEKLS